MRILGFMVMMMFLTAGLASSATIMLKDGRTVQGDIIKQDNKSLQINVDGVIMTYYADEIKNIEVKPFITDPTVPVPVIQPEAVAPVPVAQPKAVTPVPVAQPEIAAKHEIGPPPAPASIPVAETVEQDKKVLILKFMDVFGTRQALTNNFNAMLMQIAKDKPDEAKTIRQRVKVDEIIERLLPIYDRNFTSEDLKAFISFYGSTEGQKLIQTIPELMKESVNESVKYMQERFPEANKGQ